MVQHLLVVSHFTDFLFLLIIPLLTTRNLTLFIHLSTTFYVTFQPPISYSPASLSIISSLHFTDIIFFLFICLLPLYFFSLISAPSFYITFPPPKQSPASLTKYLLSAFYYTIIFLIFILLLNSLH